MHPDPFHKDRYLSHEFAAREWASIWKQSWLLAGLATDVQEPGDYFTFEIASESILITRSLSGELGAWYNVCQHRGNRLSACGVGHGDRFICPYHHWTYDLDGQLIGVPQRGSFSAGLPTETLSLTPVAVDCWKGLVFVHLGAEPEPLLDFLGPVTDWLAPYRFQDMVMVQDQTVRHQCNWKAVVDNFGELYHVDFIHPQHRRMVNCAEATVQLFPRGHTGLQVPGATTDSHFPVPDAPTDILSSQLSAVGLNPESFRGRVPEIRAAVQAGKRASSAYDYSGFTDDQLTDSWQFNLFPNAILSFAPEFLWILRPRPHPTDPQQCLFDKLTLAWLPDGNTERARPVHDEFEHLAILDGSRTMTPTIDQDIELLADVQAGMRSDGFQSLWLSDEESRVAHFHRELDRLMS